MKQSNICDYRPNFTPRLIKVGKFIDWNFDVKQYGSHIHFWDPETSWINTIYSIFGGKKVNHIKMVQTNRDVSIHLQIISAKIMQIAYALYRAGRPVIR